MASIVPTAWRLTSKTIQKGPGKKTKSSIFMDYTNACFRNFPYLEPQRHSEQWRFNPPSHFPYRMGGLEPSPQQFLDFRGLKNGPTIL